MKSALIAALSLSLIACGGDSGSTTVTGGESNPSATVTGGESNPNATVLEGTWTSECEAYYYEVDIEHTTGYTWSDSYTEDTIECLL